MRRQFLRVYLGIALVLLLAAVTTLVVVDREMRQVVDRRFEEAMGPWIWRTRQHLLRLAPDPEQRDQALERLNEYTPFGVRLAPAGEASLPDEAWEKLAAGRPALVRTGKERLLYAPFLENELLIMGPLREQIPLRGWHGRPPALPRDSPSPQTPSLRRFPLYPHISSPTERPLGRFPFQGAYFLLGVLLAILVLIGAAVYWLLRPFERRIYALSDVARTFGEGRFDRRAADVRDDRIGGLAQTFNQMAERTSRFIERQRELLHAVSHELRTPLARLFFLVDDAQEAREVEKKNHYLKRIEDSLQELDELVEELLAFVRLEDNPDRHTREIVDLETILAEVAALLADLRPALNVEMRLESLDLKADPHLFRRAVLNLATNAVRHARQQVLISTSRQADTVLLHVDDDGPGIPPEFRKRIFEPFFCLDESRTAETGSVGLGLAIVQRIMHLHHGQVHVDASPLGGARFTLCFPSAD